MKENFWTMLKVLTAIGLSVLIHNYFNGEFSSVIEQPSLINSSLAMLDDILTKSVKDNEIGDNARRSFDDFSDKVSRGEISPEELQDVAAAILNIRMQDVTKLDSQLEKIILDMEFAQKEAELNEVSGKEIGAKYKSIALKINELAAFQKENIPNLIVRDRRSNIAPAPVISSLDNGDQVDIIVSYEPVEPIRELPTSSINREESNTIIIENLPRVAPVIKITGNLDVVVDSLMIKQLDSVKVIHLKKSLRRLKHAKTMNKN